MVISRWDPWGELAALQRDVQELFGRSGQGGRRTGGSLVPPMDALRNDDGSLTIRLELPGVPPDDVEVNASRGVVTISGERRTENEASGDNWLRRERAVGSFSRSFSLPEGIDPASISAKFEHGVLELHVPAPPQERPTRIPVGGGQQSQTVDVDSRSTIGSGSQGSDRDASAT
jgi:HSP20 family protein